jgi:hypothetical protein
MDPLPAAVGLLVFPFDLNVGTKFAIFDQQVTTALTVGFKTHRKAAAHIPPSHSDDQTRVECLMGWDT